MVRRASGGLSLGASFKSQKVDTSCVYGLVVSCPTYHFISEQENANFELLKNAKMPKCKNAKIATQNRRFQFFKSLRGKFEAYSRFRFNLWTHCFRGHAKNL